MSHPLRIQRSRRSRNPPGSVMVTRGTRWGNPYRLVEHGGTYTRAASLWLYEHVHLEQHPDLVAQLPDIAGRPLACWCPLDQLCHGDVLARLANPDGDGGR